jgi:hypothetical protein
VQSYAIFLKAQNILLEKAWPIARLFVPLRQLKKQNNEEYQLLP